MHFIIPFNLIYKYVLSQVHIVLNEDIRVNITDVITPSQYCASWHI